MYVILVGGGKIGYYLTKTLLRQEREVTVVEKSAAKCAKLEDEFGDIVVCGDGAKPQVLEEAGCARADVVVALTGEDEDNFVICQLARKKFHVARAIARINNPRNEQVFRELGAARTVSSTAVIANLIEMEVVTRKITTLLTFQSGEMTILEVVLPRSSPVAEHQVKDVAFPEGCLLVSVLRRDKVIVPRGDTVLQGGDRLIALTAAQRRYDLQRVLLGEQS
ncbi:MAG: TrkA family potassium uptake protein [Thermaerobacter sp.]|nr:TrkA family potassium uptake protein [Thermaerobacter sp.]